MVQQPMEAEQLQQNQLLKKSQMAPLIPQGSRIGIMLANMVVRAKKTKKTPILMATHLTMLPTLLFGDPGEPSESPRTICSSDALPVPSLPQYSSLPTVALEQMDVSLVAFE